VAEGSSAAVCRTIALDHDCDRERDLSAEDRSGSKKRIDHTSLAREIPVRLGRVAYAPAGATGELLSRRLGAIQGGGGGGESHAEHIVQNESD
jgi:hypothetical protein